VVPVLEPMTEPSRWMSYPATATLSVEAVQLSWTVVGPVAFAVSPVGVVGACVSEGVSEKSFVVVWPPVTVALPLAGLKPVAVTEMV